MLEQVVAWTFGRAQKRKESGLGIEQEKDSECDGWHKTRQEEVDGLWTELAFWNTKCEKE